MNRTCRINNGHDEEQTGQKKTEKIEKERREREKDEKGKHTPSLDSHSKNT